MRSDPRIPKQHGMSDRDYIDLLVRELTDLLRQRDWHMKEWAYAAHKLGVDAVKGAGPCE